MIRRRRGIAGAVVVAVIVARGASPQEIEFALTYETVSHVAAATPPAVVRDDVLIIRGRVYSPSPLARVEIFVNGRSDFLTERDGRRDTALTNSIALDHAIFLKPYSNQIEIEAELASPSGVTAVKKTLWVERRIPQGVHRWVLAVGVSEYPFAESVRQGVGSQDARRIAELAVDALGVERERVFVVLDADATEHHILDALFEIGARAHTNDQVLFYYSGMGSFHPFTGDPTLLLYDFNPSAPRNFGLSVTDLFYQATEAGIPSIGFMIDTSFAGNDEQGSKSLDVRQVRQMPNLAVQKASAEWLRALQFHSRAEVLIAAPFSGYAYETPEYSVFTHAIIDSLANDHAFSFRDLHTTVTARFIGNPELPGDAQPPLYFATDGSVDAFRFERPDDDTVVSLLSLKEVRYVEDTGIYSFELIMPEEKNIRWLETFVNDVPVERRFMGGVPDDVFELPADPGRNVFRFCAFEIAVGVHCTTQTRDVPANQSVSFLTPSSPIVSVIAPREPRNVVPNRHLDVEAILTVPDAKELELRLTNNGQTIDRVAVERARPDLNIDFTHRVFLKPGDNHLALEVRVGDGVTRNRRLDGNILYAVHRFNVFHREPHPVRALVIGIGDYADEALPSLTYAAEDASLARQFLLSYTDAAPSDIVVLRNDEATRDAIMTTVTDDLPARVQGEGRYDKLQPGDVTLFVYYSGFATSIESDTDEPMRCLVPYDTRPSELAADCIGLDELSRAINSGGWKHQVLLWDTSYDGTAEQEALLTINDDGERARMTSKSLRQFETSDSQWRMSSGIEPDRVLMVCGDANQDCWESPYLGNSVFTASLVDSLDQAFAYGRETVEIRELYADVRERVFSMTDGSQRPVLKGTLTEPFQFRPTTVESLLESASLVIGSRAVSALWPFRISVEDLHAADRTLEKALALMKVMEVAPDPEQILQATHDLGVVAARQLQHDRARELFQRAHAYLDELPINNPAATYWSSQILVSQAHLQLMESSVDSDREAVQLAREAVAVARTPASLLTLGIARTKILDYERASETLGELLDMLTDATAKHVGAASALQPAEFYEALTWYVLSQRRLGRSDGERFLRQLYDPPSRRSQKPFFLRWRGPSLTDIWPTDTWSQVVLQYIAGNVKDGELTDFAESSPPETLRRRRAAASFYIGFRALSESDARKAIEHFRASVATDQIFTHEYWVAKAELELLEEFEAQQSR